MGTEIEPKLAPPADTIRKAPSLPWLKQIAAGAATRAKLQSVYFDTPTCALRNRGVSLRVRNTGSGHVQTIKSSAGTPLGRKVAKRVGALKRLDAARRHKLRIAVKLCAGVLGPLGSCQRRPARPAARWRAEAAAECARRSQRHACPCHLSA